MSDLANASKKSYRTPRRRPAHLRTKTGCIPCRQQKKKCDETPGTCKACSKRRIRCIWRSDDDVSENASPSNTASFTEADETVSQSPFSSSGLSSAEDWDSASAVWEAVSSGHPSPSLVTSNAVVRANRSVTALPLTSNVQSFTALPDALLFDHARYIFVPQLIRPDVTKSFAEKYASESLQLAYNVPFFMNAVLACSGAELRADSPYHRRLAEAHYTDAVTGLRKYLGGQNRPQIEALALRTVMLLCIFERSRLHTSDEMNTHLNGAAAMIRPLCTSIRASNNLSIVRGDSRILWIEAFMFHTSTTTSFLRRPQNTKLVDEAFTEAQNILEELEDNGVFVATHSPVLGASPSLFAFVRQISLLHNRFKKGEVRLDECLALTTRFERWCQSKYPLSMLEDMPDGYHGSLNPGFVPPAHLDLKPEQLLVGPTLYALAGRLILLYMVQHLGDDSDHDVPLLLAKAMNIINHIEPSLDYFADYYCWPFFCVGMTLAPSDVDNRTMLLDKVLSYWDMTRNGTMWRLASMLKSAWAT